MAILRSVPIELIEDALTCLTDGRPKSVERAQVQIRAIAGLAFAMTTDAGFSLRDAKIYHDERAGEIGEPAQIGQPSGIECNGCQIELIVGEAHECPVLGVAVKVEPIARSA